MHQRWLLGLLILISAQALAQDAKPLSLTEALKTAVERNLDIELQRVTIESQRISLDLTRAKYEPTVTADSSIASQDNRVENTNQGQVGANFNRETKRLNSAYSKTHDFGLTYRVDFNNSVRKSGAANEALFGTTYTSSINFSIEQQLLRGFGFDESVYRKDQFVAKGNYQSSLEDLKIQVETVLLNTEDAYWNLVASIEELKVAQQSLDLAKQLYEQNKVKIEVGTLAPIELVNTEATVASRENDIVTKENSVRAAEDALKKVMNLPVEQWRHSLKPSDELKIIETTPNLEADYQKALDARPESIKNRIAMDNAKAELKFQKNQLLPELKLTGGYGSSANSSNDVEFPEDAPPQIIGTGSFTDALSDTAAFDLPGWSVGLELSWTPFNRQAKLNQTQAEVTLRQRELETEQSQIVILEEVRAAIRDLETNQKSIKANEKTLKFREENLKAEEQKFQNGLSTNYRVSEVQEELAQARNSLIQSRVNYKKAVTKYHKALGQLNQMHNISVQ
ncbi:TolC family protein [Sulfidibacter corallicola]|uniref:TolC family protein n=1 Tax=Sulfidibacter corallicola TaxID=2818388 RepID=A0A8A4TUW9_SULCO|nr:TolC family protein [Sulfidibacter corallicola]QTD53273.1 TolC family protein [Sulfidibacter corallicola]